MLVAIGILGAVGHFLLIRAHALAPATLLSPFGYTQLLVVLTLGWLVFGELPDGDRPHRHRPDRRFGPRPDPRQPAAGSGLAGAEAELRLGQHLVGTRLQLAEDALEDSGAPRR